MDSATVAEIVNLTIHTMFKLEELTIRKLNNLVFLYDPSWVSVNDPDFVDTLPFAIFYIVKEETIQTQSVSKRRLILYSSNKDNPYQSSEYRKGVLNVVADNVVNDPLILRLECLVPFNPIMAIWNSSSTSAQAILQFIYNIFNDPFSLYVSDLLNTTNRLVNMLNKVIAYIPKNDVLPQSDFLDINRRSILSMAKRRVYVLYKDWRNWETKSMVITNVSFTKVGTEDNFYRCSMELQELPILYAGPYNPTKKKLVTNTWYTNLAVETFKKALDFFSKQS